ncbi:hypothetical protein PIB30_024692 [Stylosanthes scabra]|uniref:Uncharacterized protein n=1 Tax=Stylosanthes scabra TaxID=79078 RepID=A0ABU6Q9C8_9FABA|nr:hypothetical protein [Stylosanthes scabra]
MAKGWYDFVCRSLIPTTNRSEVTVERAVLIHSIIIGENINEAKAFVPDDTPIPQETGINGEAMVRVREPRARNPRQARQEAPQQQQPPPQEQPQPQVQQQQDFPSNFYTHFDNSMTMIYRRLDNQQEESRRSFEALNTRMNKFDDQLSFLCYSNQMTNEQMLSPYQDMTRLMREMEIQGIPVTMANLAIHRQKEEEMRQERMGYDQILQEAAAEKAREENKGKARMIEEEDEDTDEEDSNGSEEWERGLGYNRRSSERKWPERARGMKGSQQNLEGHCWTRCVRISEAMSTHAICGRHAQKAISAQMRTHSELLCVHISGSQHL